MSGKILGQIEYLAKDRARKTQNKTMSRTKITTEICCKPRNWYGSLCNRICLSGDDDRYHQPGPANILVYVHVRHFNLN
jgi:hypothetical protein